MLVADRAVAEQPDTDRCRFGLATHVSQQGEQGASGVAVSNSLGRGAEGPRRGRGRWTPGEHGVFVETHASHAQDLDVVKGLLDERHAVVHVFVDAVVVLVGMQMARGPQRCRRGRP